MIYFSICNHENLKVLFYSSSLMFPNDLTLSQLIISFHTKAHLIIVHSIYSVDLIGPFTFGLYEGHSIASGPILKSNGRDYLHLKDIEHTHMYKNMDVKNNFLISHIFKLFL